MKPTGSSGAPITLTATTGRSGTHFLYDLFRRTPGVHDGTEGPAMSPGCLGVVYHEALRSPDFGPARWHGCVSEECQAQILEQPGVAKLVASWAGEGRPVADFGWTMMGVIPAFASRFPDRVRMLVLHRHPVEAAASLTVKGAYQVAKSPENALRPQHPRAKFRRYEQEWSRLTPFEKSLWRWMEMTAHGFDLAERLGIPVLRVRSGDLFTGGTVIEDLARFTGLPRPAAPTREVATNSTRDRDRDVRGLGDEWERFDRFPELLKMAEELGYDMARGTVQAIVERYRRPAIFGGLGRRVLRGVRRVVGGAGP